MKNIITEVSYRFVVTLKHDNGTHRIVVNTKDEATAKKLVMEAEGCPECAIVSVASVKEFKVVTVSQNTNSFGLYGTILIARDGSAFEIAVSSLEKQPKGKVLNCDIINGALRNIAGVSYEIPRKLPTAPLEVVTEIWK